MVREVFVELVEEFKASIPIKHILELFDIPNLYITGKKENYKFDTKLSFNEKIVIEKYNETNFEYGHKNIIGIKKRAGHKKYKAKESSVASNVLNGDLKVSRPLEKLVTDITYLPWEEYVSIINYGLTQW